MGADLGDALGFSAYAGFPVHGRERDSIFRLPIGTMPAERSRFVSGLNPGAHVVNQPRKTGSLTEDAQKRLFDAWKPQYANYADTGNWPPSTDDDTRQGNPQVEGRRWLDEIEARRRAAGPGPVDPNNYDARPGNPWTYAEHGYPEFSQVPHGSARQPLERPGFLPSMIRSPHASTGQFHTGMPGDHIVGQPHPSNRQPPGGHVPAGFYDGNGFGNLDNEEFNYPDQWRAGLGNLDNQEMPYPDYPNHDQPPFYRPFGSHVGADIAPYPDHGPPGAQPRQTGYGGLYDGPYEGPYGDAPMHGPGSWMDPTNHLLNDLGKDWRYDPKNSPLGHTNTPRDDDAGEVEWERNIAEGNMGGYAAYDDEDYDPNKTTNIPWWVFSVSQQPKPPGWAEQNRERKRREAEQITDPFGRTHPPTMPGNEYAGYATSIPVDPNGPTASSPGDVLDDYNQQDDLRQRWNKFWSSPGTDDYRAPYYPPRKPNQGQGEYSAYGIAHEPYPESWEGNQGDHEDQGEGMTDADWAAENEWMNHPPPQGLVDAWGRKHPPTMPGNEYCGYDDMSGEVDYASSCMSMLDKLHSLRPTIYGEAGAGDDSGRFGGGFGDDTEPVGGTPDRDYWRKKTPYADQPSSHMDMSPEKARKILHDGEVHGHPLTKKQRGLFGSVAGRG
jgi:hypothetical protein